MTREIGKELIQRMRHLNDSREAVMASETDRPQRIDACDLHARESQRLQPDRTPEPPSTPAERTTQPRCIVTRLREERNQWAAAALAHEQIAAALRVRLMEMPESLAEAADEIERLRLAIRRLAEQDATLSVQGGNVTVTMDATLTDAEREAIAAGLGALEAMYADAPPISRPIHDAYAPTLRGLLERTTPHGNKTTK
jgi:hypothetical protein